MHVVYPKRHHLKIDGVDVELAPLRSKDRQVFDEAFKALGTNPTDLSLQQDVRLVFRIAMARQIKLISIDGKPLTLEFRTDRNELTQDCVERLLRSTPFDFMNGLAHAMFELVHDDEPFEVTDKNGVAIPGVEILPSKSTQIN